MTIYKLAISRYSQPTAPHDLMVVILFYLLPIGI